MNKMQNLDEEDHYVNEEYSK